MHPLVLEQLIVLAQLAQFGAKAAVLVAQRGKLPPQLRFQLPVGLKICLQALYILLQPFTTEDERAVSRSQKTITTTQSAYTQLVHYRRELL